MGTGPAFFEAGGAAGAAGPLVAAAGTFLPKLKPEAFGSGAAAAAADAGAAVGG